MSQASNQPGRLPQVCSAFGQPGRCAGSAASLSTDGRPVVPLIKNGKIPKMVVMRGRPMTQETSMTRSIPFFLANNKHALGMVGYCHVIWFSARSGTLGACWWWSNAEFLWVTCAAVCIDASWSPYHHLSMEPPSPGVASSDQEEEEEEEAEDSADTSGRTQRVMILWRNNKKDKIGSYWPWSPLCTFFWLKRAQTCCFSMFQHPKIDCSVEN